MAASSDSPIYFPREDKEKLWGNADKAAMHALLCQARASPEPGQAAAITLSLW